MGSAADLYCGTGHTTKCPNRIQCFCSCHKTPRKLTRADIAGMEAIMRSSPDDTIIKFPTWLIRGYVNYKLKAHDAGELPIAQHGNENNDGPYSKNGFENRITLGGEVK